MKQKLQLIATFGILLLSTLFTSKLSAQTANGIYFQAVARDNYSNPAKDRKIFVQSSIIQTTATGTKVLSEEFQTTTDATGVFSISVGQGTRLGGTASNLTSIDWSKGPYYLNLKIAITPVSPAFGWDYKNELIDLGTTSFGTVPYALYAGTAAGVDQKVNITDTTKMLSTYAKVTAVKILETSLGTKLTATDTLNMLAPYARIVQTIDTAFLKSQLATKLSLTDTATMLANYLAAVNTLNTVKLNTSDTATMLANYLAAINTLNTVKLNALDTASLSYRIDLKADIESANFTKDITVNGISIGKGSANGVNTIFGNKAFTSNTTGGQNIAIGEYTLSKNTTGGRNHAIGDHALTNNTTGGENIAIGHLALENNTIGSRNLAIGQQTLNANTEGINNVALGYTPLYNNTTGSDNNSIGFAALFSNTTGSKNIAIGYTPLSNNTIGSNNIANGESALYFNTSGSHNISLGSRSLYRNTTGSFNTASGKDALENNSIGNHNTAIGNKANVGDGNLENATAIGDSAIVSTSNTIQLGNTSVSNVKTSGTFTAGTVTYPNSFTSADQVLVTDVNGVASFASIPTLNQNTTGTATNVTGIVSVANGGTGLTSLTSGYVPFGNGTDAFASNSNFKWNNTFDNDGNSMSYTLGIGVNDPGNGFNTMLDVGGRASFRINSNNKALIIDGSSNYSRIYTGSLDNDAPDDLVFGTYPYGHMKQLFLKQSNAYVGINNDNPIAQLDVNGSINTSGTLTAGAVTYPNTAGTPGYYLKTDGTGTASWAEVSIADNSITSAKILDGEIVDADISSSAAIADTKLATITTAGKVSNSATTATSANESNTIVLRDVYGGFQAGNINAAGLNSSGDINVHGITMGSPNESTAGNTRFGAATFGYTTSIGYNNTVIGNFAFTSSSGSSNTAIGSNAIRQGGGISGDENTAVGVAALTNAHSGFRNTGVGVYTLNASSGTNNSSLGYYAGGTVTTGNFNTLVGSNADVLAGDLENATAIGNGAKVAASNTIQLGNLSVSNVKTSGTITAGTITYPNSGGTDGYYLKTDGTSASWAAVSTGVSSIGSILGASTANGATITSGVLNLAPADASNGGIVTTDPQTFAGVKTFNKDIVVNTVAIGKGGATQADNIAIGNGARSGNINVGGNANIAIGTNAQQNNTGYYNVSLGNGNLSNGSGDENTAIGYTVMANNTSGIRNTGVGLFSFYQNTTGNYNTAIGHGSLGNNTTGSYNTALGTSADVSSNNLTNATAIGYGASVSSSNQIQLGNSSVSNVKTSGTLTAGSITYPNSGGTDGYYLKTDGTSASWAAVSTGVSSIGSISGASTANGATITSGVLNLAPANATYGGIVTTGTQTFAGSKIFSSDINVNGVIIGRGLGNDGANVAIGASALASGTGTRNTAVGYGAMRQYSGTSYDNNSSLGYYNMLGLTTGAANTSMGGETMFAVGAGSNNTAIGNHTLMAASTSGNSVLGASAGNTISTGSLNTIIGYGADVLTGDLDNATALGYGAKVTASNTIQLGSTDVTNVNTSGSITAKKYIAIIPTATTASATTDIDLSSGNIFKINLGANITTLNLNNISAGTYILEFIQSGTFTVTFPTLNWKWSGGTAPTITATSGKIDIVTIVYDGATYFASAIQNF